MYIFGAGVTAAAGTRLALRLIFERPPTRSAKGPSGTPDQLSRLYLFRLTASVKACLRYFSSLPLACAFCKVGNLCGCCLPWRWQLFLGIPLRNQTLISPTCEHLKRPEPYRQKLITQMFNQSVAVALKMANFHSYPESGLVGTLSRNRCSILISAHLPTAKTLFVCINISSSISMVFHLPTSGCKTALNAIYVMSLLQCQLF